MLDAFLLYYMLVINAYVDDNDYLCDLTNSYGPLGIPP